MESKIRDTYSSKLQEEIVYFDKQLQEQHQRDKGIIVSLQEEIRHLHGVIGDGKEEHGNRRRSSSTVNIMTLGSGYDGGNRLLTHRQNERSRLLRPYSSDRSVSESSDRTGLSGNDYSDLEDFEDDAFDSESLSPGGLSPRGIHSPGREKSIIHELTEEDVRKRAAEAVMRRQFSSPDGILLSPTPPSQRRKNISPVSGTSPKSPDAIKHRTASFRRERTDSSSQHLTPVPPSSPAPLASPTNQTPMRSISVPGSHTAAAAAVTSEQTPKTRRRIGVIYPNKQQPSEEFGRGDTDAELIPAASSSSTHHPGGTELPSAPPAPSEEQTPVQPLPKATRRRRSIADLIFPFKRSDGEQKLFKRRHQSVVTKTSAPPNSSAVVPEDNNKRNNKNKGLSLLQAPLPGIPNTETKEQV